MQAERAQALADAAAAHAAAAAAAADERAAEAAAAAEERAALVGRLAQLQALVDESAAAHKAHAELKELKTRSRCGLASSLLQRKDMITHC